MKGKKKLLAGLLIAAIIAGSGYGIGVAVRKTTSGGTVMVLAASELNYNWYSDESTSSVDGSVATDATQNVYVTSTETISDIYVAEGQYVKKGDRLVEYDTELAAIALEQRKLEMDQIKIAIEVNQKNLETLRHLVPVAYDDDYGDDEDDLDDEEDDWDEDEIDYEELKPLRVVDVDSVAFNEYDYDEENLGKEFYPRSYFVALNKSIVVKKELIEMLIKDAKKAGRKSYYIRLEAHEENDLLNPVALNGTAFSKTLDVMTLEGLEEDLVIMFKEGEEPFILRKKSEANLPVPDAQETIEELEQQLEELNQEKIALEEERDALNARIEELEQEIDEGGDDSQSEENEKLKQELAEKEQRISELETSETKLKSQVETLEETVAEKDARIEYLEQMIIDMDGDPTVTGSILPGLFGRLFFAPSVRDKAFTAGGRMLMDDDEDEGYEGVSLSSGPRLISSDLEMTAEDIKASIMDLEDAVKDLVLDEREATLKLKIEEEAVKEGTVFAKMDGYVRRVNDLKKASTEGVPLVQVTGSSGLYVRGEMSETMLDKVHEGDKVMVQSWQSGMVYEAEITEISPYPSRDVFYGYYGTNQSASSYPFLACIQDSSAELDQNEYLQISFSDMPVDDLMNKDDDSLFLYKAFILEDGNHKYVYKRGDGGLLVKQEVEIGEMNSQGWEILSGITADDYVAFPYGKDVREGAKTREGTFEELYGGV